MIRCEGVTIKYDGFVAVENVSFEVKKGEWLFISGENGCGKSTLIKALMGLEKISGGKIIWDSDAVAGYVPQQTQIQNDFPASVFEIVLSGNMKKAGLFYGKKHRETAEEKIRLMGIENIKNACFGELSGGQKQRVFLARALCAAENVLVLDEPTSALDEETENEFYGVLDALHRNGMTIIMVVHDIGKVLKYADKVLHFGKEVICESRAEFEERIIK